MLIENLAPCKIRCENWYWNKKLQEYLLSKSVRYSYHDKPFCVKGRLLLVLQKAKHGWYYLAWTTEYEFEKIPMPEYSAKQLLELLQND